jgi:hypothetical protein
MKTERRQTPRYPFSALVEIVDEEEMPGPRHESAI